MTTVRLGIIAWLSGLVAYVGALGLLFGEWISRGDLLAAGFWSLVAFAVCYWLLYLPVLKLSRRLLPRWAPGWVYAVIATLLGIVPTALIARFLGGSFRALLTPEAFLYLILFGVLGLVIGIGFTRLDESKASNK
jgi:hypothetical protein